MMKFPSRYPTRSRPEPWDNFSHYKKKIATGSGISSFYSSGQIIFKSLDLETAGP
jgi:hypothetical protein